jgi:hypothetical protein
LMADDEATTCLVCQTSKVNRDKAGD